MENIYKNEKKLFKIVLIFSILLWILFIVGTVGVGLLFLFFAFLASLFAQSGFISYLKGNGVHVTAEQMPEFNKQFIDCCRILEIENKPELYVMNSDGFLNALAARFLRKHYVVLYSGVVDALQKYPDGLKFYIGHELGHIKRGHLAFPGLLIPGSFLPILGPAYERSQEYSSDLHGLKCCKQPKDAVYAMGVLAMGPEQWNKLNVRAYAAQSDQTGGFWMSFHELTASYPWLSKRMQHLLDKSANVKSSFPRRSPFAWFLALFVPRVGFGGGSLVSVMVVVAIIGILASIALPAYQDYIKRAELASAPMTMDESANSYASSDDSREAPSARQAAQNMSGETPNAPELRDGMTAESLAKASKAMGIASELKGMMSEYIAAEGKVPSTLVELGIPEDVATNEVRLIKMTENGFVVHLQGDENLEGKTLAFDASLEDGEISWKCNSEIGIGGCG